jgi:hypothetical protein
MCTCAYLHLRHSDGLTKCILEAIGGPFVEQLALCVRWRDSRFVRSREVRRNQTWFLFKEEEEDEEEVEDDYTTGRMGRSR